jgi:hypothetical protein
MFSIDKLSGVLSLFVGLMLFFIAAMDNSFRGRLSITPEAYQVILDHLMLTK